MTLQRSAIIASQTKLPMAVATKLEQDKEMTCLIVTGSLRKSRTQTSVGRAWHFCKSIFDFKEHCCAGTFV